MKSKSTPFPLPLAVLACASILTVQLASAFAQGTAFTYNGRLNDGATPATGTYDLRFALCGVVTNGPVTGAVTNSAMPVTNGLFTVTLDFGDVFTGASYWLELAARTNGGGTFTTLTPRQPLTPAPYALHATTAGTAGSASEAAVAASAGTATTAAIATYAQFAGMATNANYATTANVATNLAGTIAPSQLTGAITSNQIVSLNAGQVFGLGSAALTSASAYDVQGAAQAATNDFPNANYLAYKRVGFLAAWSSNGLYMTVGSTPTNPVFVNNQKPIYYEPRYTLRDPSHIKFGGRYYLVYNNEQNVGVSIATSPDDYHWTFYGYMPIGTNYLHQFSPKWFVSCSNTLKLTLIAGITGNIAAFTNYVLDVNPSNPTNFWAFKPVVLTNEFNQGADTICAQIIWWNGYYRLFTGGGDIYVSADLDSWHEVAHGALTGGAGPSVVHWSDGRFYYTGSESSSQAWQWSTDTTNWTAETDYTGDSLNEGTAIAEYIPNALPVTLDYTNPVSAATLTDFFLASNNIVNAASNSAAQWVISAEVQYAQKTNAVFIGAISGDGSGLTNLSPANLGAGTAAISISGNAASASGISGGFSTNILIGGHTFFIANGAIMNVQ